MLVTHPVQFRVWWNVWWYEMLKAGELQQQVEGVPACGTLMFISDTSSVYHGHIKTYRVIKCSAGRGLAAGCKHISYGIKLRA